MQQLTALGAQDWQKRRTRIRGSGGACQLSCQLRGCSVVVAAGRAARVASQAAATSGSKFRELRKSSQQQAVQAVRKEGARSVWWEHTCGRVRHFITSVVLCMESMQAYCLVMESCGEHLRFSFNQETLGQYPAKIQLLAILLQARVWCSAGSHHVHSSVNHTTEFGGVPQDVLPCSIYLHIQPVLQEQCN